MNYKELFRTDLFGNKLEIILDLNCYKGSFKFSKNIDGLKYKLLKTATFPMNIDKYTGNISTIEGDRARVVVKMGEKTLDIGNVRILDEDVKPLDRVIISEHVTLNGSMEWVATKKPLKTGDLNFLTIALEDPVTGELKYKKRIDVVTGESLEQDIG